MMLLLPSICLFACILSLGFEHNNQTKLALKTKLLASLAFVGFAWDLGAWNSQYGQLLFVGLVLSMFGDWSLGKQENRYFLVGIGAFLLAHSAYALAFLSTGFSTEFLLLILLIVTSIMITTTWWLKNHLNGNFKWLVPLYLIVISWMLVSAWSNETQTAWGWIMGGASLFAISDLFVARNRFIQASHLNRIIGLPLYYMAQLMLAFSVSLIK